MASKAVRVKLHRDGPMCFVPVPFDPRAAFGKARAPVKVALRARRITNTLRALEDPR